MLSTIKYITITVFVMFGMLGCGGQNDGNKVSSEADSLSRPDSEVLGAKIFLYNKGRITTEIVSKKIIKFEAKDSTMAYQLDIDILDSTGNVSTKVIGDSGIIRENEGVLNIYGNVVVVTEDKSKLETDYLWWDSKTDRIKTDAFVKITKGEDVVTGWGLDADNKLTRIRILNQVSGRLSDPQKLEDGQ